MTTESKFPTELDDDISLPRVDDNLTEIGGEAINALRDSMFNVQSELGLNPSGTKQDVAERLDQSLNPDGTIKASALESVGLATLPIADVHVATNAGIKEHKLDLYYHTDDLNTKLTATTALTESVDQLAKKNFSNLLLHVGGAEELSDGYAGRHVASQIDLNAVPNDTRDVNYSWAGLKDKNDQFRSATQVAQALLEINDDLVDHQTTNSEAHPASAIIVDTSNFEELSQDSNTVQKALEELDQNERIGLGRHRATEHSAGIPRIARSFPSQNNPGEGELLVPWTGVQTFLTKYPNTSPVDDQNFGDDIVKFLPNNTDFSFDAQFSRVRPGDLIQINYQSVVAQYLIDSVRFLPNQEWVVRLNGVNLFGQDGYDGYATASISRPLYDYQTAGVLALASANANPNNLFSSFLSSLIVGSPRGATVVGLGFNPHQLDSNHYKLYLQIYPTGNPADKVITLPAIDVTGDQGTSSGSYTIEKIVQATNNAFRKIGYNYRFIAFEHQGQFGLMLADAIDNVSFSIVSGDASSGSLATGIYTENVIGGSTLDQYDALGIGLNSSNLASPAYFSTYLNSDHAQLATKIFLPFKNRFGIVNGQRLDRFAQTYGVNQDGYWEATISARTPVGGTTVEVTYLVEQNLAPAELKPGKTLVVQPLVSFDDPLYNDVDYGRFIIKSVFFDDQCGNQAPQTQITVINGIHATGNSVDSSSGPGLKVRLYFSEDSIAANLQHVIDSSAVAQNYARWHEVYFDEEGKTFTHERARLPIQVEDYSPSFLGTSRWRITDVSPKLRGYRDNLSTFNKYVRFYILTYDAISGEFSGYLGQRDPLSAGILRAGPVTFGRKNRPVRFYDETGNDFIELEFREFSDPGASVLSTNLARFVDIELFDSLQRNDELFFLGSCEINWDPQLNQDIVECVKNKRSFGSVSEDDLSSSALEYLSVPEKYLHENGVLFGLDFVSINSLDNREITFLGGKALVNGKIVHANNSIVNIPFLYPNGEALPQSVKWVICLNQFGQLIPYVLTASKDQYFATNDGVNSYYLDSVTLEELLHDRKDLCPIYIVEAQISSVIIGTDDIFDIRRYVEQESASQLLTWSTKNLSGNFRSFSALKNWINNYGAQSNLIQVSGNFEFDTSLDCTDFQYPVHFIGNGAKFVFNSSNGILLGSNLKFENIIFEYAPAGITYDLNYAGYLDLVNSSHGCLYFTNTDYLDFGPEYLEDLENIVIENCSFFHLETNISRPPFISFLLHPTQVCRNIQILNCRFFDTNESRNMAAVAFICSNQLVGSADYGAILTSSKISGNICDKNQGIYCTSLPGETGPLAIPGLCTINTEISGNQGGVIGYCVSGFAKNSFAYPDKYSYNFVIKNNTVHYIASLDGTGTHTFVSDYDPGHQTGHVVISQNFANWIHPSFYESTAINSTVNLTIENNTLQAYNFALIRDLYLAGISVDSSSANESLNSAIFIYSKKTSVFDSNCKIINNSIVRGNFGAGNLYRYNSGMFLKVPALISGNIIRGIVGGVVGGGGKSIFIDSPGENFIHFRIVDNFFYVEGGVSYFIYNNSRYTSALVTGNYFDRETTDGSSQNLIFTNSVFHWVSRDNKNETQTATIRPNIGTFAFDKTIQNVSGYNSLFIADYPSETLVLSYQEDFVGDFTQFRWRIPLYPLIPYGAKIIFVSCDVEITDDAAETKSFEITISNSDIGSLSVNETLTLTPGSNVLLNVNSLVSGTDAFFVKANNDPYLIIYAQIEHTSPLLVKLNSLEVTYRW